MVTSRKALTEALSRPGIRLRSLRRLPVLSRIAVAVVAVVVLMALLAPLLAPARPARPAVRRATAPGGPVRQSTGWARTASAATSSAG